MKAGTLNWGRTRQGEVVSGSIEALSVYLGPEKVEMVDRYELATIFTEGIRRSDLRRSQSRAVVLTAPSGRARSSFQYGGE